MANPWEAAEGEISGNWEKASELCLPLGKHAIYVQSLRKHNVFPNTLRSLENDGIGGKRPASHPSPSDEVFDCGPWDEHSPAMPVGFEFAHLDAGSHRLGADAEEHASFRNGHKVEKLWLIGSIAPSAMLPFIARPVSGALHWVAVRVPQHCAAGHLS
jgi:hypothetical protein